MSCSEYQCSVPRNSCICALIYKIPLSDARMDDLKTKSSDLGYIALISIELMYSKYHYGTSQVMF